jgi:hypothetical protein
VATGQTLIEAMSTVPCNGGLVISSLPKAERRVGLLDDVARLRDEWQRVQGTSVDDPQRAVREASVLVDRILDKIRVNVGSTHPSETMSTEELRMNFQRYRESFQRLLSA